MGKAGVCRLCATVVAIAFGLAVWLTACEYPSGAPLGNAPPETRLSNVPANDTIAQYIRLGVAPTVTLNWIGNDPDGYVTGFSYRWTNVRDNHSASMTEWTTVLNVAAIGGQPLQNVILVKGHPQSVFRIYHYIVTLSTLDGNDIPVIRALLDSLATLRTFAVPYQTGPVAGDSVVGADPSVNVTPTRGTFTFDSPDSANRHLFEVRAIDNADAVDPTPDLVNFWTLASPRPIVAITEMPPENSLAVREATYYWRGLRFEVASMDASTFDIDYQWSVDDTLHWSVPDPADVVYVTASDFRRPTNPHVFYARARNTWGVLSPVDSAVFSVSIPLFEDPAAPRRILVINNDHLYPFSVPGTPDSNQVKAFYAGILDRLGRGGTYDIWTNQSRPGPANWPSRDIVSQYAAVVLVSEVRTKVIPFVITGSVQDILREYLFVGGKLIVSCMPDPATSVNQYGSWSYEIYHAAGFRTSTERDFVGARGRLGYPDIRLDQQKIPPDSVAGSTGLRAIRQLALHTPRGFAEVIYMYDSGLDRPGWENLPLGLRFLAPPPRPPEPQTYSVVMLGFPLYFMEEGAAELVMRKAFEDIRE